MSNACLWARYHLGVDFEGWVWKRNKRATGAGVVRSRRLPTFTPTDFFLPGNKYIDRERTGYVTE